MIDQTKASRQNVFRSGFMCADPPVDAELDLADAEPALGSLDGHDNQEQWADGDRTDREPSLAGGGWSRSTDDREQDDSESGIADIDGLLEQIGSQDWQNGGQV